MEDTAKPTILIVDDTETHIDILADTLDEYDISVATDGESALEAVESEPPDLILLDIMMPGIDGYEVCRRLKSKKATKDIPVIFLTAKNSEYDEVEGFVAGAVDYITKPLSPPLIKARVMTHLSLLHARNKLEKQNKQLGHYASQMETLAEERARQLVHADRMATLGVMSAGIAHEINNPLTFISNNIQLLEMFWNKSKGALLKSYEKEQDKTKQLKFVLDETPATLQGARKGIKRIVRIVNGLKGYARKDEGTKVNCNINQCIEEALEISNNALKHNVTVKKELEENLPEIQGNVQEIEQVLINLFVNAAHAIEPRGKGSLKIKTESKSQSVNITIEDTGQGIPDDKLEKIWEPFYTSKSKGKGTGLGLSISKGIVENHKGTIRVENSTDLGGAKFIIELPC